ncbi:MAG: hypothetical protein ACREV0_03050 [Burkholderiales bacterium]
MLTKSRLTIALVAFFASLAANAAGPQQDFFEIQRRITDGSPYGPPTYQGVPGPRGDRNRVPAAEKDFFETRRSISDGSPGEAASPSAK